MFKTLTIATALALSWTVAAQAQRIPTAVERPERLPELVLGSEDDINYMSQTEYQLKLGQAYRLEVTRAGYSEIQFRAPDLVRRSWIRKVQVGGLEIQTGYFHGLEFDDQGTIEFFFTPAWVGEYEFFVEPYEEAMRGRFVVTTDD
jgi:hypothetical protein